MEGNEMISQLGIYTIKANGGLTPIYRSSEAELVEVGKSDMLAA
jgi:hypothetical protein